MSVLRKIDDESVHRICSGQVILDLSMAVKELVENAVDAGASSVQINLKNYGFDSVQVLDNGHGIPPSDFHALGNAFTSDVQTKLVYANQYYYKALQHHTSKIQEFRDICLSESFGFRGEALSSLSALVASLSVTTCSKDAPQAFKLVYNNQGVLVSQEPTARSIGTTITLTHLFESLPVRLKEFKRNLKREYGKCIDLLHAYALNSQGIRFVCTHLHSSGKSDSPTVVFQTHGSRIQSDNITSLFGLKFLKTLMPFQFARAIDYETDDEDGDALIQKPISVSGFVSKPSQACGRSTSDRQYFFINDRPCDLPRFSKMINEVYREFVPQRCPAVIMNLTLEKGSFDVNVTPDKRTILLHEQDKILDWLRNQLSQEFAPFRQSDHIFSQSDSQNTPTSSCLIQSASFLSTQSFVDEDEDDSPRNPEISLRQSTEITLIQNKENFSSSQPKTPQITSIDITDEDVAEALPSNLTRQSTLTDLFSFNSTTSTSVSSVTKLSKIRKSASSTSLSSSGPSKKQRTLSFSTPSVATRRTRLPIFSLIRKDVEVDTHDLTFGGESPPQESQQDFPQTPLSTRRVFSAGISSKTNDLAEAELERFVHKQDFTKMEVIGQFNLGFIVVRLYDDLFVVDQHASNEKYTFENLMKNVEIHTQALINPIPVKLSSQLEYTAMTHRDWIQDNGFGLLIDEDAPPMERLHMTSVPQLRNLTLGLLDLEDLVQRLSLNESQPRCKRLWSWYASKACRTSVMIGMALTRKKMKRIVKCMAEMEHPWNCPHGRPTMRHLMSLKEMRGGSSR